MPKRILSLALILSAVVNAIAKEVRIDGIWYALGNTAQVIYYNNYIYEYKGDIVIPEYVEYEGNTYRVTGIRDHAFYECGNMTSITLPSSIESIGEMAFGGCKNLTAIHITDLDAWLRNWLKIDFGGGDANPLTYAHHLFLNGEEVKDLVIPDGVTTIKMMAFCGWSGLNSIAIPSSLKSIGQWAFNSCSGLTAVHISDLEAWCRIEFTNPSNPLYEAHHLFLNGEEIKNLVIPDSFTSIGDRTFRGCSGLTSVVIPSSVTSIGESAFQNCSGLTSITIPENVKSIQKYAFFKCSGLSSVTIPGNITYIGEKAFAECSALKDVTIPGNVTSINDGTFASCDFQAVTIGDGVKHIGKEAFKGCSNMKSITIPPTVTTIGEDAFKGCNGQGIGVYITDLEAWCKITFDGVYSNPLGNAHWLFLNGERITDLVIPANVTDIGDWAFYSCRLNSVTVPGSVKHIGLSAFRFCQNLSSVTIEDGVMDIGDFAFCECASLKSISMGNSLKNLGTYAFSRCYSLKSIAIPDGVTRIGVSAFQGCQDLTYATLPNSLTTIENSIFRDCYRLASVIIGSGVKTISFNVFPNCPLTDVYCLAEDVPTTNPTAFVASSYGNATLHVPAASVDAYQAAVPWFYFKEIVAMTETPNGIATVSQPDNGLKVQARDGVLTIEGASPGTPISVYDLSGRCLGTATATAVTTMSTMLKSDTMAIVRVGSKAVKVMMK